MSDSAVGSALTRTGTVRRRSPAADAGSGNRVQHAWADSEGWLSGTMDEVASVLEAG